MYYLIDEIDGTRLPIAPTLASSLGASLKRRVATS